MRQFSARPEQLVELVAANTRKAQIVIDEIQKLPALLEVVHLLIERKTGQQFVLTFLAGSTHLAARVEPRVRIPTTN